MGNWKDAEMDYYEDMEVDKHNLDFEWEDNGRRLIKWGVEKAEADYLRDKAKEQLDLVKSIIEAEIRDDPGAFELGPKPTLPAINSVVIADERYYNQNDVFLQCVKNASILTYVVSSFTQRKTKLENLTKIWLAGMYSDPVIPKEAREKVVKDNSDKIQEKVKAKLKKTRKKV